MIDYYFSIVTGNCNTILILSFLYTNVTNFTPLKSNIGSIGFELTTDSSFNFEHLYRGMYTHNSEISNLLREIDELISKQEASGAFQPDTYEWCGN